MQQNFIVFGSTRSGIEPMIYCTRGEHANHYTNDAVQIHTKNENFAMAIHVQFWVYLSLLFLLKDFHSFSDRVLCLYVLQWRP